LPSWIKELLLVVPAWVAATVAVLGLSAWRRQLVGREHYDLARRLLRAAYRFRDSIQSARDAIILAPSKDPTGAASERDRTAAIWQGKWDPINAARRELEAELLESEVLWGSHHRRAYADLFDIERRLFGTVLEHMDSVGPDPDPSVNVPVRRAARRAIMYARSDSSDDFSQELLRAVAKVETDLRPRLRNP
jgi:hypothetical protein